MALPGNLVHGLLPSEAEYVATSNVEINIVPLMRIDRVRLLDGVYGPLRPPMQARIPLWMALNLKKRKRCSIVCPEWMQVEQLKLKYLEETTRDEFATMPLHYVTVCKVLLEQAPDDIPDSDQVRGLIKSIREARQSKVMSGIDAINTEHLAMENISLGEVTELRGFLSTAFDHLLAIQRAGEADDDGQARTDSRQFTYSLAQDEGPPDDQNERFQTPYAGRTTSATAPTWSAGQSMDEESYGAEAQRREERPGNAPAAAEESMNNMDLF